jgi:hypothetical protein
MLEEKKQARLVLDHDIWLIAQDQDANPVYPSDTDDLEWRDPAPEDVEYPYSAEDPDDDMYINI